MKRYLLVMFLFIATSIFTGCIAKNENNEVIGLKGIITGATYKPELLVDVYRVVVKGVVTFMTKEQIEALKLDKVDMAFKYAYSVTVEGKKVIKEDADLDLNQSTSL